MHYVALYGVRCVRRAAWRMTMSPGHEQPAKILIAEDHPAVRNATERIIACDPAYAVCGEATTAHETMALIASEQPDLLLLDLNLKGDDGLALIKKIRRKYRKLPILILSMHRASLYEERALRNGANGYLMKCAAADHLMLAIQQVLDGKIYASESIKQSILQDLRGSRPEDPDMRLDPLSDRELQVFRFLGEKRKLRDIAEQLQVSVKTVESHRTNIRRKLGLDNNQQLSKRARAWNTSRVQAEP